MQYISFYKNRLPFKPRTNVVIYFDVTGIGMKRYYGVINEYYDRIVKEFQRSGLEDRPLIVFRVDQRPVPSILSSDSLSKTK